MDDFRNRLKRNALLPWQFHHIPLPSGITLSIQASEGHYSRPRETLSDPFSYTLWEIGIPFDVMTDARMEPFREFFNPDECKETLSVGGYLPTHLVQEMVDHLAS